MPAKKTDTVNPSDLVIAAESYSYDDGSETVVVNKGQILRKNDPRVKPGLTRPATEADLIEQATAGPGEHRSVSW